MSIDDGLALRLITEYIPKRKQRSVDIIHAMNKKYPCANPQGEVSNIDCPEDDPLCNCPCRNLRPTSTQVASITSLWNGNAFFNTDDSGLIFQSYNEWTEGEEGVEEPHGLYKGIYYDYESELEFDNPQPLYELIEIYGTKQEAQQVLKDAIENDGPSGASAGVTYDEPKNEYLNKLLEETKECNQISSVLSDFEPEKWLGCDWKNPDSPFSCECPCVGEYFYYYLRFNQTVSTFWDTPPYVPLLSLAHRSALLSQQVGISVNGDMSLRPGDIVYLDITEPPQGFEEIEKIARKYGILTEISKNAKFNGKWMITTIIHRFAGTNIHKMDLILVRDGIESTDTDEEG